MKIIDKNEIVKLEDGVLIEGLVYMGAYSTQPTKNGGKYIAGNLEAKGTMMFKVWQSADCFDDMCNNDYQRTICRIRGRVNVYNRAYSLLIEGIQEVTNTEGISAVDFFENKYDANVFWKSLNVTLSKHLSADAMDIFNMVVTDGIKDLFTSEFAATSHHDNCRSGLLAHTTKVVKMCSFIKMYPEISKRVGTDLLYLGAALHDIGKVVEYSEGIVSDTGKLVSHMTFGVMMLEMYRKDIIRIKDEHFYYSLVSVISQHAGEYGDRPRTILAYVLHLLDCMDANLTLLNQALETTDSSTQVVIDGFKLL